MIAYHPLHNRRGSKRDSNFLIDWFCGEALIDGLTLVGIPKAVKTVLNIKKNKVDLTKEELSAPGREVAFISHCQRKFET